MPRMRRYEIVDIPQHVVQRGNNRQETFRDDRDRRLYSEWLSEVSRRYACEVHAYVLMTNHVHLLMTPRRPKAIARLMQVLGSKYVRHYNDRHGRTGTLWEGRYHASLVASGRYFLICSRYIELNPVRARLVDHPADYPWSSYGRNALARSDRLVTEHPEYTELGGGGRERAKAYRRLFDGQIEPIVVDEIRRNLKECRVFGPEAFKDEMETRLQRPVRRIKPGPRAETKSRAELHL